MGVSTFCCLNALHPRSSLDPTSTSPSVPTRTATNYKRKGDEISSSPWRTKYMIGLACSVIIIGVNNGNYNSMASELVNNDSQIILAKNNTRKVAKWSEKRICEAWNLNSLETIVPENLPRPSAHRKWEKVSYSSQFAPQLTSSVKSNINCFTM